ncbi:RsmB/NOP family class I SAM-dependent RNA methyltransferase [Sphingomonas sp. IC-56]|uniref:RsmB/NOP family class I SAM-dependent RNA methyltransferase n=1 Tax=Sphingomonas sp. IC-56 TaxID=2898529 RepID=UPI001E4CF5E4|nr:RsmB/NOP family class I SAM-dependent RNA methyltransferase [Sphingomonas sp. IC-56]MCD2325351.1 RsmB/NOP family class I SAM-dependent RNA methyltransferase [Sphingomonas sp. IC-56]
MTPAARSQAAIDLLDRIIVAAREGGAAADTLIARWFAERRYAGSKDRRAIRGLVYDAIRLCGERPESGRAALVALARARPELGATFDGSSYGPAVLGEEEVAAAAGVLPGWLRKRFADSGLGDNEQAALLERAPLDIRLNRLKPASADLTTQFEGAVPVAHAPDALRLPSDTPLERLPAYAEGLFEIQDAGSQMVTTAAEARPGMKVVDLCAGGGGKTLALAAAMANQGSILACDVDRPRLSRLAPRAERAGVTIAETRLLDPGREAERLSDWQGAADLVLIDAPCSGTGTWRRNPEARWRLTDARLKRLADTQASLLDVAVDLVAPGGSVLYIVCSLLDAEGADQIAGFLRRHPGWAAEPPVLGVGRPRGDGARLTPLRDGTDGFFVAKLVRA